jgi:hypothetical protein
VRAGNADADDGRAGLLDDRAVVRAPGPAACDIGTTGAPRIVGATGAAAATFSIVLEPARVRLNAPAVPDDRDPGREQARHSTISSS